MRKRDKTAEEPNYCFNHRKRREKNQEQATGTDFFCMHMEQNDRTDTDDMQSLTGFSILIVACAVCGAGPRSVVLHFVGVTARSHQHNDAHSVRNCIGVTARTHTHTRAIACTEAAWAWAHGHTHTDECLAIECGCAQRTSNESGEASLSNRIDWFEPCSRPITVYNRWSQTYPPRFFFFVDLPSEVWLCEWKMRCEHVCVRISMRALLAAAAAVGAARDYWSSNILFMLAAAAVVASAAVSASCCQLISVVDIDIVVRYFVVCVAC